MAITNSNGDSASPWNMPLWIFIIILLLGEFFTLMAYHWRFSESKSHQVSRTLLSILVDLNNAVVWMFSTCSHISKSSSLFTKPLGIVLRASITIGITVTFMSRSFFSSLANSRYLSLFLLSFYFTAWSAGTAKSNDWQVLFFFLFFFFLLTITRSGRLVVIWWSVCILKF